jgi:hypothetical protein
VVVTIVAILAIAVAVVQERAAAAAPPLGAVDDSVFRLGETVWVGGGVVAGSAGAWTPNNHFDLLDPAARVVASAAVPIPSHEFVFWASATDGWVLGNVCSLPMGEVGCSQPRPVLWRVEGGPTLTEVALPGLRSVQPHFATLVGTVDGALLIATATMQGTGRLHALRPGSTDRGASIALPEGVDPYVGLCRWRGDVLAVRNRTADGLSLTGFDIDRLHIENLLHGTAVWSGKAQLTTDRGPRGTTWLACGTTELAIATTGPTPRFAVLSAATGAVAVPPSNPLTNAQEQITALDAHAGNFLLTTRHAGVRASYWTHREGEPTVRRSASRTLDGRADLPHAWLSGDRVLDVRPRAAGLHLTPRTSTPPRVPGGTVAALAYPSTWTHNICGAAGCGWLGDPVVLNGLKWVITVQANAGALPLAVGIQETCPSQRTDFGWFLLSKNENYRMATHIQLVARDVCGSSTPENYGVAAYAIGSRLIRSGQFSTQYPGDELRGWVCIQSAFPYVVCTAHMSFINYVSDGSLQWQQFLQYLEAKAAVKAQAAGNPVFWGGDFYVTPQTITNRLPNFFTTNPEADLCRDSSPQPTVPSGRKVDYAFRDAPTECSHDAAVHDTIETDHMMVGGYL